MSTIRPPYAAARPIRIARRCWVTPEAMDDLALRCLAVLESSAPDTVIASVTAARLHGLWLPQLPDSIHVATATPGRAGRQMTRTRRPEFVAHRFQLKPEDITVVGGVPLTSIARTWTHLAQVLDLPDLVAAGDSALRSGVSREDLARAADRSAHTRRKSLLPTALDLLDGRSRSRPESHLRVAVTAVDLPRFDVNTAVHRDLGGWLSEPDLSLAAAKLALEYQGEDHADVKRMRKDISRAADMRSEQWTVLEFGPAEVFGRPAQIRSEVRLHLRKHAPHLLVRPRWSVQSANGQLGTTTSGSDRPPRAGSDHRGPK